MNRDDTIHWIDQLIPGQIQTADTGDVVTVAVGGGQQVAVTIGFADVDTGLVATEEGVAGTPVRSELIAVARADAAVLTRVLGAAATILAEAGGTLHAQPGTMIPRLAQEAGAADLSVAHGLFVPPYLWGGETPRVTEEDRLTVMLQLVMLTDAEYAFAVEEGPGALQQALGEAGIDLLDWQR